MTTRAPAAKGAGSWSEAAVRKAIRKVAADAKGELKPEELPHRVREHLAGRAPQDLNDPEELDRLVKKILAAQGPKA